MVLNKNHWHSYTFTFPPSQTSKTSNVHGVMKSLHTIYIVGAGIPGLTLASCLQKKGIKAIIFDKNPSAARHNYGISLQPCACQVLLKVLGMDESIFFQRVTIDGLSGGNGKV